MKSSPTVRKKKKKDVCQQTKRSKGTMNSIRWKASWRAKHWALIIANISPHDRPLITFLLLMNELRSGVMSSIMGHAGRLTRNCKLDREGSSASRFFIPGHDGCWAFAALNNQNRIRSAAARIGPQFSPIWNSMRSVQWVQSRDRFTYPLDIYRAFREFLEYFGNIYLAASWQRRMNVNLENFGV